MGNERWSFEFIPIPVSTFGGWHEVAEDNLRKLGKTLARQTNQEDEALVVKHLSQRMSVLLMRGNAALLINRRPSFPGSEVDGAE